MQVSSLLFFATARRAYLSVAKGIPATFLIVFKTLVMALTPEAQRGDVPRGKEGTQETTIKKRRGMTG